MTSKKLEVIAEPGQRTILLRRSFDAPAALVFEAWTRPELVRRWWGRHADLEVCEIDLRVGGRYRFVQRDRHGGEVGFTGEYREIARPGRLVSTQIFEQMRDAGEALETVTFEEKAGKTTVSGLAEYPSVEVRDGVLASGMAEGVVDVYAKLDGVLAERAAR